MSFQQQVLLQTDIVDSTRLAERLGDAAMSALWAAHDRLARDLLREWRGREIDKSDGFLLLFGAVGDALGYALAYHRANASLTPPLAARAGLHVGALTTRTTPSADVALGAKPLELDGVAKPTTARVMALAAGGQTLMTGEARAALGPGRVRLQSHGHWRVKGLDQPIEVIEAASADTPFVAPPDSDKGYRVVLRNELWLPLRELRHGLPAERDAFVGRRDALRWLAQRLDAGCRLVTVLGLAGTGKSRLAKRFGWVRLGDYSGGVWFCDLSQARGVDGIARAVAQGCDITLADADPIGQLGSMLVARGPCLVILDNFEQVARHAEATLGEWLNRAGEACFIVTSREVLGIRGEEALPLAPLPPADAATLFLRRAGAARSDFNPTPEDRAAIDPLVRLLDGLPLAIELAAARVRVMPPRMLLKRMSERFKLLTSGGGRSDRQATLRTAFDWSWDLMSPAEKTALAQLSVFEGGFTLDAAEAVLDLTACEAVPWAIDVVQSLVEKSFVRQVTDQRFDLLGSLHEYAAEHLCTEGRFAGSGPAALAAANARHWQHFAALDERQASADGCVETDNLVVACRRAAAAGDAPAATGALVGAWAGLKLRGPFHGAVVLAESVRQAAGLDAVAHAQIDWVAGSALHMLGRGVDALICFERGLAMARTAGDRLAEARLLHGLGELHNTQGRMEAAQTELTRALALTETLPQRALQITVLNSLAALANDRGLADEARRLYEEALALAVALRDRRWEGGLLGNLGTLHHLQGRLDAARTLYEQALLAARDLGDRQWEGNTRCNLGLLHHDLGRSADARAEFEAALTIAREMGHVRLECIVLCNLGLVAEAERRYVEALDLQTQALAIARRVEDRRTEGDIQGHLGLLSARLGRIDDSREHFRLGEALLHALSARSALGLLWCRQAEAEHLGGDLASARAALQRAVALARDAEITADSELALNLARVQQQFG